MAQKITRRMKWIVAQMREHGAVIQEHRDAFSEKSWWELWWQDDNHHSFYVTKRMRLQLIHADLIERTKTRPVYQRGKFVTQENTYGIKNNEASS